MRIGLGSARVLGSETPGLDSQLESIYEHTQNRAPYRALALGSGF